MSETEQRPTRTGTGLRYMPALDGVRAVSILGIMANHGGFAWAAGGVISVNVFFVLSGFLITVLLMREWERSQTIRLRAFWARRARRLLPALFVLLGAIGLYAVFFAPAGTQSALRGDGLSTLLYFSNWHQIITGQSYFAQISAPSPLLHTWTLSIEEQFYVIWPLLAVAVLKLWRSPRVLLVIAVAAVLASAVEMGLLFHPGLDPSRVYYGTDTRAQDILTGSAFGILLYRLPEAATARAKAACSMVAVVAASVFAFEWSSINRLPDVPYYGGFLLADVLVGLVIFGVTLAPAGLPARMLSWGPLTFVGRISYGLYLWHWPVFLVLDPGRTDLDGWPLFLLRLAVTFVIATASWYLVETPVRRLTFRNWRSWAWIPVGAVTVPVILFVTTLGNGAAAGNGVTTNIFLDPSAVKASLATYENAPFPTKDTDRRVLVVGDSLSLTVGFWLSPYAARYGLVIRGRPLDGCGLATAVPYDLHGTPTYPLAPCAQWPSIWRSEVTALHPQEVVLVVGWWDAMDRMYQGRWQHLGDRAFDAYEAANLERAVTVLHSSGAHVAIMTSPFYDSGSQPDGQPWDEDSPTRVDILNAMITAVARRHPATVSVIALNRYLDPDGHFTAKIDGRVMRFADGVHTTEDAGTYLAPKILPQLAAPALRP